MTHFIGCRTAQERISVALVDELPPRERLEADAHVASCAGCADAMRDLGATAVALERTYAPLRGRGVMLSPARVRLAVRAPARPSRIVRYARLTAKLNELAVAAAVMVFAVLGTAPSPAVVVEDEPTTATRFQLTQGFVEPAQSEPYVSQRIGRYLLHDTLLDARVVPVSDWAPPMPRQAMSGEPY